MIPAFTDPAARRRWTAYFADVDRLLAPIGNAAGDLREELAAHVADSVAATAGGSEAERLDLALARLGRPIDYLRPLLADRLLEQGTRGYRPVTIARGLWHAARAGSYRAAIAVVFALGYLLLALFAAMAVLKPLWGEHVGVFRNTDGTISAGIVAQAAGAHELLGWWSVPIALALAALLYVALTRGLRAVRQRR